MVSGVSNNPPPTPPPDLQRARDQTQQAAAQTQQAAQGQQSEQTQQDTAKQAAEAQKAQEAQAAEARRAAVDAIKQQGAGLTLPQEFMGILDAIVQESYEVAKPPDGGKTGDQGQGSGTGGAGQKNVAQEMQKDMQIIREFLREAKHMITNQGMETAQMLNTMKVAQGGAFWSKLQQVLQKGIPVEKQVLFQKLDKPVTELPKSLTGAQDAALRAAMGETSQAAGADASTMNPGQAMLELLKAEGNPAGQLEHFLAGLYILNKDDLQTSAGRLRSYLRRRGQLPEHDFQDFRYQDQRKEIFQGPMPREAIQPVNFWYILLAIGTFAASVGLGLNIVEAAIVGVLSAVIMFVLSLLFR